MHWVNITKLQEQKQVNLLSYEVKKNFEIREKIVFFFQVDQIRDVKEDTIEFLWEF